MNDYVKELYRLACKKKVKNKESLVYLQEQNFIGKGLGVTKNGYDRLYYRTPYVFKIENEKYGGWGWKGNIKNRSEIVKSFKNVSNEKNLMENEKAYMQAHHPDQKVLISRCKNYYIVIDEEGLID
jgi:hypothetical protein